MTPPDRPCDEVDIAILPTLQPVEILEWVGLALLVQSRMPEVAALTGPEALQKAFSCLMVVVDLMRDGAE